ncbi:MAG TPA: hypothetical protein VHH73_03685 [Verrucomicrobiae bacterium]|nr:hypothetical protein [Verrucomicrobiae bacterium]
MALLVATLLWLVASPDLSAAGTPRLSWDKNMLHITGPDIPGGAVDILWWEAFCRRGSTDREWERTTIPHRTELVSASKDGRRLQLLTKVEPSVEVTQDLRARPDGMECTVTLRNRGKEPADLEWFEPCIRVDKFTGRGQKDYPSRCFIYTADGLKMLDQLPRNEEARYHGGQVYVPPGIDHNDVNPRPISPVAPFNGLMGCFSADDRWLLATAWNRTQHLFQGVIVCIHADPHVGGLKPGETKRLHGRIYLLPNDPAELKRRYEREFHFRPGKAF